MEFGQPAAFVGERVGERVIDSPDPSDVREPAGLRAASVHVLASMLDVVDYGLLLVSAHHSVSFANRAARLDLDECHPLRLSDRSLTARHRQDSGPLRDALDSALCKGLQRLLTLGRNSGHAVSITVLPIEDAGFGAPAQAVVVMGKRAVCGELSAEAFARQHGLTPAELRVLKQLYAGHPAAEIAMMQGVALTTVRTQISSVRDKTGSPSIGALVRAVARLPPLVSRLSAACGPRPERLVLGPRHRPADGLGASFP